MAITKKGTGKTRSSPAPEAKKAPVDIKPAGANITQEVKDKYPFYVGRLYKEISTGGLYQLNALTQDFKRSTQWVIVFTNVLNSKVYSLKAEDFIKEFKLVEMASKGK